MCFLARAMLALVLVFPLSCLALAEEVSDPAAKPVNILYVTSVGWFHDYEQQAELLIDAIGSRLSARFDIVVGDIARLRDTDFATGYDVLIYNFCHASRRDSRLVENLMQPVREQGIPLVAVHCTMHSFQHEDAWHEFLGLKTLRHEQQRSFTLERGADHITTRSLQFPWLLESDELYINIAVDPSSESLITAYGIETESEHVQAWVHRQGDGLILGTTLGHARTTLVDPQFAEFLARGVAFLSDRLNADGSIASVATCGPSCATEVVTLTPDVRYPSEQERQCVLKALFASSDPWPAPEDLWPDCGVR